MQQKYLMAAGNSGMFPDNLDEKEKKAFVQEALSDLYHSDEVGDRELAVMTLGEFTGKEATEAMLFALNDPDDIVREQAIMQISDWKNEKERTELVLKVLQGHDPDALVLILESVTDIDDEALAAKIKELLDHPDETVREAAQLALELQD
ncbi:MAG: HEAT repeat domain-containing protein [Gammaproteobacteria bacterium]